MDSDLKKNGRGLIAGEGRFKKKSDKTSYRTMVMLGLESNI